MKRKKSLKIEDMFEKMTYIDLKPEKTLSKKKSFEKSKRST